MRKIGRRIGAVLLGIGIVWGCPTVGAAPTGISSTKRQVPVYRKSLSEQETIECTFFSDMPHVPYIPLESFYSTFMNGRMKVTRDGSRYTYEDLQYGSVAVADADKDTLTSQDMADFLATPAYKHQGGFVMGGPEQLVKVEKVQYDQPPVTVTLSVGKYGIDLREENGVLYFPFATVSDLFSNPDVQTAYYAEDAIYYEAEYEELNGGDARMQKGDCLPWILRAEREDDVITFNYRELCFSVESFYGYPCSYNEFADAMYWDGLDKALQTFDPEARTLLLSKKSGEYIAGLYRLFNILLADGGHTGVTLNDVFNNSQYANAVTEDFLSYSHYRQEGDGYYIRKSRTMSDICSTLSEQRLKDLGAGGYYTKGDTALISFDKFEVDYAQWNRYLSGTDALMPDDTIGFIYHCLERADQDSAIKNAVFDVSTNGGGDTIALNMIIGLIRGTFECRFDNVLSQQVMTQTTTADTNFDGAVRADDRTTRYPDLRFAVLSSGYSFSCANLMTALMKEGGSPVLGETSGGGACAVLIKSTADGVSYHLSSYARFASTTTNTVDDGIAEDISLVHTGVDGQKDYSAFYDLSAISEAVNRYYDGQENSSPIVEISRQEPSDTVSQPVSSTIPPITSSLTPDNSSPASEPVSSTIPPITSSLTPDNSSPASAASSSVLSVPTESSSGDTMLWLLVLFGLAGCAVIAAAVIVIKKS